MAHKSDYDKYYYYTIIAGTMIMAFNLYYYCRPLLGDLGNAGALLDSLALRLRSGGAFTSPVKTKLPALALFVFSLVTRGGKGRNTPWWQILASLAAGGLLFLFPYRSPGSYLLLTLLGLAGLCWGTAMIGRRIGGFNEAVNDRRETFEQCEELIDTPDSFNLRTQYFYRGRWRDGWVNCVAPARGTLIMGVPGSGKSFSVFEPMIEQMITKGYTMFIYDYKYPALTEVAYNDLLRHLDGYRTKPEFCVINFEDPRYSLRCNPLNPAFIADPSDSSEVAELVMLNINKTAVEKEDFFTQSAKLDLDSIIWYLRNYEGGRYCTFAHAIQFMSEDYKKTFHIMSHSDIPGLEFKIKSFVNAMEGGAQDQLQGQIASAQIPLGRFISPQLYWVLTGDDFTLDINNPEHPKILCVGNDPQRQTIYGTTLALITSRLFRTVNVPGKERCGVLIDEFPTVYLKGIDNLIDTARSNRVCVALGCQDKSQVIRDYGEKEAKVIFNTVGNIISGQVNGETAEDLSKMFGREFRKRESQTLGMDSDSVNISFQQDELIPRSNIETLSQGVFLGKVADTYDHQIGEKLFCGKVIIDMDEYRRKKKARRPLPQMTDFGEDAILEDVLSHADEVLMGHFRERIRKESAVAYDDAALTEKARALVDGLSKAECEALLDDVVERRVKEHIDRVLHDNFMKVQEDIRGIIRREYDIPMGVVTDPRTVDPRLVDPFQ